MNYYPFLVLFHHVLCLLLSLLSLNYSVTVIFYQQFFKNTGKQLSFVLTFFFIFVIIWSIASFLNRIYLMLYWRPEGNEYNGKILFWIGIFPQILGYTGTVLEIFLSADRCISMIFHVKYTSNLRKYYSIFTVICLVIFVVIFLWLNPFLIDAPSSTATNCTIFGCFIRNSRFLIHSRIFVVACNVLGGIFLFILIKFKLYLHQKASRRISKTILIIIASSTFFEVFPVLVTTYFLVVHWVLLNNIIGPFDPTCTSINIAISVYLYSKAFTEALKLSDNRIRVISIPTS